MMTSRREFLAGADAAFAAAPFASVPALAQRHLLLGLQLYTVRADLAKDYPYALITVGHIYTSNLRVQLFHDARRLGFTLPVVVSPRAHVSRHAHIGDGTVVLHGAIVNSGARIGMNCIVNSQALVEHDVTVGDHCHVSTGAILNGDVRVGACSFIGSASVVKQGLTLGDHSFLGMGIALKRDLDSHSRLTQKDST
jgi:sugar O-acyltransferase (sialic acid O-acetyltransferase NeuD family)